MTDHVPFVNRSESKSFLRTALTWHGTVSPIVMPRVLLAALYACAVTFACSSLHSDLALPITPFEYSGAALGLLLVLRVNAGLDRWWEARKLWGSIVNQSRNLAIGGAAYAASNVALTQSLLGWVASWPHVMRESLRGDKELSEVAGLIGLAEAAKVRSAEHMPTYVGYRIGMIMNQMRDSGLDDFAFLRLDRERALLIDAIGACERIRNTPMPFVIAAKTRRFILLFLLFLPFALYAKAGYWTPMVMALAAYPLFSLDEIGAELQNPFSPRNLSHLPLHSICQNIEKNVLSISPSKLASYQDDMTEKSTPSVGSVPSIPSLRPRVEGRRIPVTIENSMTFASDNDQSHDGPNSSFASQTAPGLSQTRVPETT